MSASAETPIFAGLSASSILDVNMAMPFFLLTDGKIDFDMTAGVKTSVSFGVRDTKPYFDFKPPTPFFDTGAKVSASLAFQQGLQYILNEFSIGICAGGTCTGITCTPMLQALHALLGTPGDATVVDLAIVYGSKTEADILTGRSTVRRGRARAGSSRRSSSRRTARRPTCRSR